MLFKIKLTQSVNFIDISVYVETIKNYKEEAEKVSVDSDDGEEKIREILLERKLEEYAMERKPQEEEEEAKEEFMSSLINAGKTGELK